MRLKIQFETKGKRQILPMNYQYPVSAWVYKVLAKADKEFTAMLHNEGYVLENGKTFKLFTFSKLSFPKHTWKHIPKSDRMEVWARKAWLTVSFQLPEQIEKFVMGLFKEQEVFIGDKISGIQMQVVNIENLGQNTAFGQKTQDENITIKFKTLSPIVIGQDEEGKDYEQYINPMAPGYKSIFTKNLIDKYKAAGGEDVDTNNINFEVTKLYTKTELQTIKAFTPAETKIRAYHYEFALTAPQKVIEVGYNSGFGSMNSVGFGFCEVVGEEEVGNK